MQISTKCKLGDEVWFFRSGKKVDKFSEIACGRVININIDVEDENICITYVIKNKAKEIFYREDDMVYNDFIWISMVATQNDPVQQDEVKKAYELLGKALGLV